MGIWGRLRFARKPICVIGEISVAPPKKENDLHQRAFIHKCVLLPQHLVAIVQSAGNIQPRDRLKCQAADILHNTFHVSSSALLNKFIPETFFPEIFLGGKLQNPFLNISEKQKLFPDLLVVSASIVVLAFGSNGQVSLLSLSLTLSQLSLLGLCYICHSGYQISSSKNGSIITMPFQTTSGYHCHYR